MKAKDKLLQLLHDKALSNGEAFELASGRKSKYYVDSKQVTLSPAGAHLTGEVMLDVIKNLDIDAVGGLVIGAVPIVDSILHAAHHQGIKLDGFYVRKEAKPHGKKLLVEGPLKRKARVVIVDDVATTGSSILKAIQTVKQEKGAKIVRVIALVDRCEGARENLAQSGYEFDSIFTSPELRTPKHEPVSKSDKLETPNDEPMPATAGA